MRASACEACTRPDSPSSGHSEAPGNKGFGKEVGVRAASSDQNIRRTTALGGNRSATEVPRGVREAFRREIAERERCRLAELDLMRRHFGLEPVSDEMKAAIAKSVAAMRSVKVPSKRFRLSALPARSDARRTA